MDYVTYKCNTFYVQVEPTPVVPIVAYQKVAICTELAVKLNKFKY